MANNNKLSCAGDAGGSDGHRPPHPQPQQEFLAALEKEPGIANNEVAQSLSCNWQQLWLQVR